MSEVDFSEEEEEEWASRSILLRRARWEQGEVKWKPVEGTRNYFDLVVGGERIQVLDCKIDPVLPALQPLERGLQPRIPA